MKFLLVVATIRLFGFAYGTPSLLILAPAAHAAPTTGESIHHLPLLA
jgi:hypothetical protein